MLEITKSSRITIREISEADKHDLAEVLSDPIVMKYSIVGVHDDLKIEHYINKCKTDYYEKGYGNWLISSNDDQKFIGICGLNVHIVDNEQICHINYRLCSSQQGKGYAFEAVEAVKKYVKLQLKLKCLYALIDPNNIASLKVAQKAGFSFKKTAVLEGFSVDVYKLVG